MRSNKWVGGYEASCPMREGLELRIVDNEGAELFYEHIVKAPGYSDTVAKKIAPFSWEAIGRLAKEQAERLHLRGYYEWKEWLVGHADEADLSRDIDDWIYTRTDRGAVEKIAKLSFLGKSVWLTRQVGFSKDCKKRWSSYEIRSKDLTSVEDVCGFDF